MNKTFNLDVRVSVVVTSCRRIDTLSSICGCDDNISSNPHLKVFYQRRMQEKEGMVYNHLIIINHCVCSDNSTTIHVKIFFHEWIEEK